MISRKARSIRVGTAFVLGFGWVWLGFVTVATAGSEVIPWRQDFERAEREARDQRRPIWIQFTGPWCHFCTRMECETFVHPKIINHARHSFIPIKLRSDLHEALALRYGLTGLPATVLVTASGEVLAKHEGFVNVESFHAFLTSSLTRFSRTRTRATAPVRAVAEASRKSDAVALAGYCPVSLVADRKLVPGQNEVSLTHEGRLYRFANALVRNRFQKQPERYIPVNGGRCPVNQVDRGEARPGDPRWGVLYEGHLYLCADDSSRKSFLENPDRYAPVDDADRRFCPHCWTRDALLARGEPQYSLTRNGRRFFCPDPGHLVAFRTTSETARR